MLTWFLFRLSVIVYVFLFWNVCIPSTLIGFDPGHFGIFWFMVATDVFALAWLVAYVFQAIFQHRLTLGRGAFAVVSLVFVLGNLALLPLLVQWREVQHDADASLTVLQEFAAAIGLPVHSRPYVPQFPSACYEPHEVQFGYAVLEARQDWQKDFWSYYEQRTSRDMTMALKIVEQRLSENRRDGKAWAMKALVYGNAVDYGVEVTPGANIAARKALDNALEYAPGSNLAHAAYGLVMRNRDVEGAETRLKQCVAEANVRPHHRRASPSVLHECHNLYGDLLRKTGRAEQAGYVYLEGLERWPENGELHVSYALYLQETGRPLDAIEYLREFVASRPSFPRGHWHLAVMLYEEGGSLDEARQEAVKALEMDAKIWNGEKLLLELLRPEAGKG